MKKVNPLDLLKEAPFHGANRLADKNYRWCWTFILLMLLAMASMLVGMVISRYITNTTHIIKFESADTTNNFPSIMLCPEITFSEEKIESFLSEMNIPYGLNKSYLRSVIGQLAAFYSLDIIYDVNALQYIEQVLDFNGLDVESAGRKLTSSCEETLLRCRWEQSFVNCSDLFTLELTADGFCCIFNARSLRRDVRMGQRDHHHYYWKSKKFGFSSSLMLAVNQTQKPSDINLDYKWIALQTGQFYVDTTVNGTPLNPRSEQWLTLRKWSYQISETAVALNSNLRKCKLTNEVDSLKYFPIYNKKYCLLECEIEYTWRRCQCLRLIHPILPGRSYCRANELACSRKSIVDYHDDSCNCIRTCNIDYVDVQAMSFNLDNTVKPLDPFYQDLNLDRVSIVKVLDHKVIKKTLIQWSYFSDINLFSQIGGMFNIFFGCSVLTIFAIFQIIAHKFTTIWYNVLKPQQKINKVRNGPKHYNEH